MVRPFLPSVERKLRIYIASLGKSRHADGLIEPDAELGTRFHLCVGTLGHPFAKESSACAKETADECSLSAPEPTTEKDSSGRTAADEDGLTMAHAFCGR